VTKRSRPLDLDDFDALDWDEEGAKGSNLAHILEHDIDDMAVEDVRVTGQKWGGRRKRRTEQKRKWGK
jgi:hypothetical protein